MSEYFQGIPPLIRCVHRVQGFRFSDFFCKQTDFPILLHFIIIGSMSNIWLNHNGSSKRYGLLKNEIEMVVYVWRIVFRIWPPPTSCNSLILFLKLLIIFLPMSAVMVQLTCTMFVFSCSRSLGFLFIYGKCTCHQRFPRTLLIRTDQHLSRGKIQGRQIAGSCRPIYIAPLDNMWYDLARKDTL